jgi:integrase
MFSSVKSKRLEVKEGSISIPIYVFSDGRFCVDTVMGGERKRITRTSLEAAKTEARRLLAQIATGRRDEDLLSISEAEDYRLAKEKLIPFGVSLLTVVEEWISLRTRIGHLIPKSVPEIVEELLTAKELEGVSKRHLEDRRARLRRFSGDFRGRIDHITAADLDRWLNEMTISTRTKNNYRSALQQLFRFARSRRHLSRDERLATDDVAELRVKEGSIEIYTPPEMRLLLSQSPTKLLPFFVLGAFAGLRTQEIFRLEWSDVRFAQGVIEVAAAKAKTASRRLVPICRTLHQWLAPLKKRSGRVLKFNSYTPFDRTRAKYCDSGITTHGRKTKFEWKNNALRHSYASYRLAEVKDAAQVALEMGNSPAMLFRNYRELVTEKQATEWFGLTRAVVRPKEIGIAAQALKS